MATVRTICPPFTTNGPSATNLTGALNPCVVNGRNYAGTPGSTLDVPYSDAPGLEANGWRRIAVVGTTAQRPSPVRSTGRDDDGISTYVDTTLGVFIVFDFAAGVWRNAVTGAAV